MSISLDAANALESAIDGKIRQAAAPRRRASGTVARVDKDGTAYVIVDGSEVQTPASGSVAAVKAGDTVNVTIEHGVLTIDGNTSDPSAGTARVVYVERKADDARDEAERALSAADSAVLDATRAHDAADAAQESADDAATAAGNAQQAAHAAQNKLSDVENVVGTLNWIAEHGTWTAATETAPVADRIYYTRTGSGTSQDPYQYTVVPEVEQTDNPASKGWYYLVVDESVQAYIASHLWLDNYGLNLSVDSANGYRIHQGTVDGTKTVGTYIIDPDGNDIAKFGADGAQIGRSSAAHSVIDANGQRFYGGSNGTTQLANIGYGPGSGTGSGASTTPHYTFGTRYEAASAYDSSNVYTIGDLCRHDGNLYICTSRTVTGEWNDLYWVLASGNHSLVAGSLNCAARESSQAFGYRTKAVGSYALATGIDSIAWGATAHAQNRGTWASTNQTAIGKYNEIDYGSNYALLIGNGTADDARSNAAAITWLGEYIAKGWAGIIQMFGGSTPPAGWLLCDGSAVSRTTYATLFAAIGTTWGAGDGSTTFNLPDLRGRAPIGAGTGSGLTARTLGGKLGSENIQAHTHAFTQPTITAKYSNDNTVGGSGRRYVQSGTQSSTTLATASGGAVGAVSDASTGNAGNMQPSAVVNFIIHTGMTS